MTDLFDLTTPQDSSKFVNKILTNDLLFEVIFDACSSPSLVRVSHTCRTAYAAVQTYMVLAFDVNVLLSRYFPDPLEFRILQRRTGAPAPDGASNVGLSDTTARSLREVCGSTSSLARVAYP